jgi:hypothetical protein|nr:MAG TPA: chromosome partitioning protein [Caudoviricetes sp.]
MALFESLIKDAGKGEKKAAGFAVTMVHYTKLIPSENNNYSMDSIKELAQMIVLAGGVKQNLLARKKTPDEYELIAGHRRRQAVKYLVEELGHEEYAMLPVHVERDGDLMSEVNLILTNCGARNRSEWERMMEVTRLTELLKAMQTGSQEERDRFREWIGLEPGLSGRELRKLVAELTGMSETKVAQLNHINNNLAPEMMDKFQTGQIGVSVANKAAGLPAEKQQELAGKDEVKLADVKAVSDSDTGKEMGVSVSDSDTEIPGQQELAKDYPELCPQVQTDTMDSEVREIYLNSLARKLIEDNKEWCIQDFNGRVLNVVESEKQYKQKFRGAYSVMYFPDPENEKVAWADMQDACIQIWSGAGKCLGNVRWFYLCAAVQSMWNVMAMEKAQRSAESQDAANEQQDGMKDAAKKQQGNDNQEEPEAAGVTDILKMEYDRELLEGMIRTQEEQLEQLGPGWKEDMPTVYIRHCMMLQAYKLLLLTRNEEEPTTQPELPHMKNNDQRKEWLRNYKPWGIWYRDEHIGSTFYKYDFECGARLVVEEFVSKYDHGDFTHAKYHLIGGPEPPKDSYRFSKWARHEEYNHYPNSDTELVEFLKYIQKEA